MPTAEAQPVEGRLLDSLGDPGTPRRIRLRWGVADCDEAEHVVQVGTRILPDRVNVTFDGADGQPALSLGLAVVDGVPQCRRLELQSHEDGRPVRAVDLSTIRLDQWTDDVFAAFALERSPDGALWRIEDGPAAAKQDVAAAAEFHRARRSFGTRHVTHQRVAEVYRENIDTGPSKAVALEFGVQPRTARKYVHDAAAAGYLPETTRGRKRI